MLRTLSLLWRERSLLKQLTKRSILERYRGSLLGIIWVLLYPLCLLAIYGFVFIYVLRIRWGIEGEGSAIISALMLYIGLLTHHALAESLTISSHLLPNHTHYVKKVVFPLEILVPVKVISACFQLLIGLLLMCLIMPFLSLPITPGVLLFPLIILPFLLLTIGLGWIIAALAVYIRDLTQLMGLLSMLLLFGSPILFPADRVPEPVQTLLNLNPLTLPVEALRGLLLRGEAPALLPFLLYSLAALAIFAAGAKTFRALKPGFADVL